MSPGAWVLGGEALGQGRRVSSPLGQMVTGGRGWIDTIRIVLVVALLAAAWQGRTVPLRTLGAALVHEDALDRPADVAVVSMASPRSAALEAAKFYRRGLVRGVWISQWREVPEDRRVDALGVRLPRHHEVARAILERAGVPSSAIVQLDETVSGLESEMAALGRSLRARPAVQPIVLTMRSHTARARLLLRDLYAPESSVRVRAPRIDRFAPEAWWSDRDSVREVLMEYAKLVALFIRGPQAER